MGMHIAIHTVFLDADSLSSKIREMVFRRAISSGFFVCLVADRPLPYPRHEFVSFVQVESGEDAADSYILSVVGDMDLVITRDIPFAAKLAERGIRVINDRGTVFDLETVRERLSVRDFSFALRQSGIDPGKKDSFGRKELHAFAAAFDKMLTTPFSA